MNHESPNSVSSVINLGFPEAAYLHKRIPKKQFIENGSMVASDQKLFREYIKNIYWEYTLKSSTCPVLPYRDNEREYLEIAVLQVEMNSQKGHKRIAEIIHRIIPYPLMIGFCYGTTDHTDNTEEEKNSKYSVVDGSFALSIAPKRFSQSEHGAFVAERFYTTEWLNSERLNYQETAFIRSLSWDTLPLQNYGTLYKAWIDRFTGYECAGYSGEFSVNEAEGRFGQLARCRELESGISQLRGQMKKAEFNRKVELNVEIKKLERELKQLAENL